MKTRRILCLALCFILLATLAGCFQNKSDMPFNGELSFHGLKLTIPTEYIRDSTQSTEDIWLFEQGWYKKTIILLHRQIQEEPETYLAAYANAMEGQGVRVEQTPFMGLSAFKCSDDKEGGVLWQELSFVYNGAFYAIAMNGATEAEFSAFLHSVTIP